jgi:hypothetical protein
MKIGSHVYFYKPETCLTIEDEHETKSSKISKFKNKHLEFYKKQM